MNGASPHPLPEQVARTRREGRHGCRRWRGAGAPRAISIERRRMSRRSRPTSRAGSSVWAGRRHVVGATARYGSTNFESRSWAWVAVRRPFAGLLRSGKTRRRPRERRHRPTGGHPAITCAPAGSARYGSNSKRTMDLRALPAAHRPRSWSTSGTQDHGLNFVLLVDFSRRRSGEARCGAHRLAGENRVGILARSAVLRHARGRGLLGVPAVRVGIDDADRHRAPPRDAQQECCARSGSPPSWPRRCSRRGCVDDRRSGSRSQERHAEAAA